MPKCDACGHDHDALTQQLTDAQTQLATLQGKESGWTLERSAIRAGLDDEGVDVARTFWDRIPADKRPQGGFDAWIADRASLPRAVQAYFPATPASPAAPASAPAAPATPAPSAASQAAPPAAPPQAPAAPPPAASPAGQPLPRPNTGTVPAGANPGPGGFAPGQIKKMTPEQYKANRANILAAVAKQGEASST